MKKLVVLSIVGIFIISACGVVGLPNNDIKNTDDRNQQANVFTHAVFAEDGTATWCQYCHYAHAALKKIYASGDYPFYYVTLVDDNDTHAAARVNDYNIYGFPTVWFDGGYKVSVGGGSGNENQYRSYITQSGSRVGKNIDVTLNVIWLGDAAMNIEVSVHNRDTTAYSGRIRVYVTEVVSSMGWHDTTGKDYTFPLLDYAFNEVISIAGSGTWTDSIVWDGHNYNDGHGHTFGTIQYGNIMVLAAVFNSEVHQGYSNPPSGNPFNAYYVDNATGFEVGIAPPIPPSVPNPANGTTTVDITKVLSWAGSEPNPFHAVTYDVYFGTTNPPPKVMSNKSGASYTPTSLSYHTTYYWKIVAWDTQGRSAEGPIWHFTTIDTPNASPTAPTITGLAQGKKGVTYTYNFTATDSDNDNISYYVDWGDNTTEQWNGPHASGQQVSLTHTWSKKGTYTIKAKAKDEHDKEGAWGTLEITMPTSQFIPHFNLIQFLQKILERFPFLQRLIIQ